MGFAMKTPEAKSKHALTAYVIKGIINKLSKRYPNAFTFDDTKIVPLKAGIKEDILNDGFDIDPKTLDHVLRFYTNSIPYHKVCSNPQAYRYDLKGESTGNQVGHNQSVFHKNRLEVAYKKVAKQRENGAVKKIKKNGKTRLKVVKKD